jgi:MFS family permease
LVRLKTSYKNFSSCKITVKTKTKMANLHFEKLDKGKIKIIGVVTFLLGFGQAVLLYVMSSYFRSASGTENVGIFYLSAYAIELIALFNFHKVVSLVGRSRTFLFILLLNIPLLMLLIMWPPSVGGILVLMLYIIIGNVAWVCLDMFLESCSVDSLSGRIRGAYLTVINAGYIFGPFLSMKVLNKFDFSGVFTIMVVIYSLIFIISLIWLREFNYPVVHRVSVRQLLSKVSRRRNIMRIYYVSFALEFFYALMVMYTPLYLRDLGLPWGSVGIIFTVMLIPFVLVQYPAGLLADKKLGEKELIILSLVIMGLSTFTAYFVHSISIFVWSFVLFSTRIGAALVEILRDSYFYKKIESSDIDLIDFFRTSRPVAYILAAISSTFFFFMFPHIKSIFILVALVVFSALLPASKLRDNRSEREMARD